MTSFESVAKESKPGLLGEGCGVELTRSSPKKLVENPRTTLNQGLEGQRYRYGRNNEDKNKPTKCTN